MLDFFFGDERGATSIEYALVGSLVSIFIVAALLALGDAERGMFKVIQDNVVPALGGTVDNQQ